MHTGMDLQATRPNREKHNFSLTRAYQYTYSFIGESEFNI